MSACAYCAVALEGSEQLCPECSPVCVNCGASDSEAGPIDLVTGECLICLEEHGGVCDADA